MLLYVQLFSEYHTEADQPWVFVLLTAFVSVVAGAPQPQQWYPTLPQSYVYRRWVEVDHSEPLIRSLLPVGVGWRGVASRHFVIFLAPVPACRCPRAYPHIGIFLRSCHRAARRTLISRSPPTGPPSSSLSPFPPFVQYFSFPLAHALPRILLLTPRRIRARNAPTVHLHSLSVDGKAYPDREQSSRLSSLYPPPGRHIRTPSGPAVHLHSLSAAGKAYPNPEGFGRSTILSHCEYTSPNNASNMNPDPQWIVCHICTL